MIDGLRTRARTRPSLDTAAIRDAVSSRVHAVVDRSRAAVADQRSRLRESPNRARIAVLALLLCCIALTAVVTRQVASNRSPADEAGADLFRSLATARDSRAVLPTTPAPVRSTRPAR